MFELFMYEYHILCKLMLNEHKEKQPFLSFRGFVSKVLPIELERTQQLVQKLW